MKFWMVIPLSLVCSACVSNQNDLDESFGAAFVANNAAQIVDPAPAASAPDGDGAAVDLAIERYKTDTVKKPATGPLKQQQQGQSNSPAPK